jgi:hypothetical protein
VGLRAEALRPGPLPLPQHPRHVVDDRGPRHVRGDRGDGLRPRTQPGLADGPADGRPRGPLPEGRPGHLRPRRVAGRRYPVPLRGGVPAPAQRGGRRGHHPEAGPPAREAVSPLPGRPDGEEGDRHRPPPPMEGVGRAGDAGLRAGRGGEGGAGPHAVAAGDRPRHPADLAPLQPGRPVGRLHELDAHAFPGDPSRPPGRRGRPTPRPAQRRIRPRLDSRRWGPRLRRAAGAPDVLALRRPEPGRRRRGRRAPSDPRGAGPRPARSSSRSISTAGT